MDVRSIYVILVLSVAEVMGLVFVALAGAVGLIALWWRLRHDVDITGGGGGQPSRPERWAGIMIAWLTRFSIRTRTVLLVVAGLAVILAVLGTLSTQALRASIQAVFDERLRLAQVAALHIDDHVAKDVLDRLGTAAASEDFDLTDADPEPERRALRELYAAGLFAHDVFITDRQGRVLWMEPPTLAMIGVDFSTQPEVRQALQTGKPQISGLVRFHQAEKAKVTFVVPVKDPQGTVTGLIGGAADPTSPPIAGILSTLQPVGAGHVDLVDQDGMVLASTEPAHGLRESHHRPALLPLLRERKAAVGVYPVVEDGVEQERDVVAFAPLNAAPWAVSIEQPEAEVLAPVYTLRRRLILAGAVVLLVTVLLTWLTTQAVLDPLGELLAASRRVAAGDLETPVPALGRDEIGELGRSFEAMRGRLKQHEEEVAAWGEELERQVAERTREFSALYAIDRAAAQSLDLDEILDDSLDTVLEALEVEAGGIYLLEPDGETMTLQVHRGVSEEFVEAARRIRLGEGVSGQAAAEKRPVVLDVPDYPTERLAPVIVEEGFQTLASTPLMAKGRVLGALNLGARRPRAFPPEELDLLATIGQQLGGAVENARLYERERRLVTYLRHLNQATTRANANLQLDILAQVVESLVEKFGAAFARLWVVDELGEHLVLRASAGLYTRLDGSQARVPIATDPHKLGVIARERQPLITNAVQQDPHFDRAWAEREGLVSFAGCPVVLGDQLLGLLALFSRQPLDEEILDVLGAFVNQVAIALQNTRFVEGLQEAREETEQRARQLALVGDIARRAVALLDPDTLLWETARAIQTTFGYPDVLIFLVDHEGQQLIRKAWAGRYERDRTPDLAEPIEGHGILDWVATHGETVLVNDVSQDPRYVSFFDQTAAELCAPLKDGEIVLGGINVESEQTHAFDQSDVLALKTLADNLVTALRNAHLYQETRQRLTEISALFTVSGALRGTETVEGMLPIILEETIQVVGADSGAIFLVDEVTGEFVASTTHGRLDALRGLRLGPDESVCGYVARTGAAYPFADLAQDPHTGPRVQPLVTGVQGGICIPLLVGETLVGTLIVGSEEPRIFGDDEVRLLTAIADMAASAVHRASLFEELEHRVHDLEALFAMGQAVTASLRVEDVLDLVVEVAPRTLHAEGCYLFLWDKREERLVLRAVEGFLQEHVGRMKYRLGESLVGWGPWRGRWGRRGYRAPWRAGWAGCPCSCW